MRNSPWLVASYALVIIVGLLVALPNMLSQSTLDRLPSWLPHSRVALGLDLRGGSYLMLEVDRNDLVNERMQGLLQESRRVLRDKNINVTAVRRQGDAILVTLRDAAQRDQAVTELQTLSSPINTATTIAPATLRSPRRPPTRSRLP